jgi:hypothetical protein
MLQLAEVKLADWEDKVAEQLKANGNTADVSGAEAATCAAAGTVVACMHAPDPIPSPPSPCCT